MIELLRLRIKSMMEILLVKSSIDYVRSQPPLEIEEVNERLMRIGGIAHQAEYLIISFLVKDAPLWYVFKRLSHLNHMIEVIRRELQAVISIVGMPGLGKTTLANKLYNHPSVRNRFDRLAWYVVSQTYKTRHILANILNCINSDLGNDSILNIEEMRLVEHIHKTLIGRRYLIVLDDIWDSNVLDELLRYFPKCGNGSRILFTSRNKDVAPPDSIIHELPFLTDEECWELLEKKVFGNRTCPPQLQSIGKKIGARCCGLPLMVVVIAGVLSSVDVEESRWEEVGGSLDSYTDNSVMQILELSYKHLPDHLKSCFLYFGEFMEELGDFGLRKDSYTKKKTRLENI